MIIHLVSREFRGLAEAGGVKDVVADLAFALRDRRHKVSVFLPWYGCLPRLLPFSVEKSAEGWWEDAEGLLPWEIWSGTWRQIRLELVRLPIFTEKKGLYTYTAEEEARDPAAIRGQGHRDSLRMNLAFSRLAVLQSASAPPEVLHFHDGHTAWGAVFARRGPEASLLKGTRLRLTIHNAGPGYHQDADPEDPLLAVLPLSPVELSQRLHRGRADPLVLAAEWARLNTVSPPYAEEVMDPSHQDDCGGLGEALASRGQNLAGFYNGLRSEGLDPRNPEAAGLPAGFDPLKNQWEGKLRCRRYLTELTLRDLPHFHGRLDASEGLTLLTFQSRLVWQKGLEGLTDWARTLLQRLPAALLVMGQGEKHYEEQLRELALRPEFSGRVCFINEYGEAWAPLLFAAGDFFLIPSAFEPCGLTDLKALLMGNLPIVRGVGGLKKIEHGKTGFVCPPHQAWEQLVEEVVRLHQSKSAKLEAMKRAGFRLVLDQFNWDTILKDSYEPWYKQPDELDRPFRNLP